MRVLPYLRLILALFSRYLTTAIASSLRSARRVEAHGATLFANRGRRVANPFDRPRQLIFAHTKMPRPILNMIPMLKDDFAAIRSDCCTDHLVTPLFKPFGIPAVTTRIRSG